MNKIYLLFAVFVILNTYSYASEINSEKSSVKDWNTYNIGKIIFEDKAPNSNGSKIYHQIIKDPEVFITKQARTVLATLYKSPKDSIPPVNLIHYVLKNTDVISAKGGEHGNIFIFYSTKYIEKFFSENNKTKFLFETRGVLLHELTHAYQLEPQGIGTYFTNRAFFAFIEGMADAVRQANGGFNDGYKPKGGSYMDGYRTAGSFFVWLKDHKDPEFLRKFNKSTLEVIPWSFDGAIKFVLGDKYNIDDLWHEYQINVENKGRRKQL